jgi:uncharacterized C2H2 Zn-finger protein
MGWVDNVHRVPMRCPKCGHAWTDDWCETKAFDPPHDCGGADLTIGEASEYIDRDGEIELCGNCPKCEVLVWAYCIAYKGIIGPPFKYRWFDYDTETSKFIDSTGGKA